MKKILIYAMAVVGMLACTEKNGPSNPVASNGALPGKFSVNASKQVQFSQGNLQYQASTKTWQFAEKQYDMIGDANSNISETYEGWIDLFGWGTGNNPTNTSKNTSSYSSFVDWGVNAISNGGNKPELWRTLTRNEWAYIFIKRTNAAELFGLGSVNGVNGVIILPDNWVIPQGMSFTPSTKKGLDFRNSERGGYYYNSDANNFSHNSYTVEQWSLMEKSGAVFLSAAGYRERTSISDVNSETCYWSTDLYGSDAAFVMQEDSRYLEPQCGLLYYYGLPVRLVR